MGKGGTSRSMGGGERVARQKNSHFPALPRAGRAGAVRWCVSKPRPPRRVRIWRSVREPREPGPLPPEMSSLASASCEPPDPAPPEKKPLKPCCACPETKKARDACIIEKGEEHCGPLIEAHKECMRALGFKV